MLFSQLTGVKKSTNHIELPSGKSAGPKTLTFVLAQSRAKRARSCAVRRPRIKIVSFKCDVLKFVYYQWTSFYRDEFRTPQWTWKRQMSDTCGHTELNKQSSAGRNSSGRPAVNFKASHRSIEGNKHQKLLATLMSFNKAGSFLSSKFFSTSEPTNCISQGCSAPDWILSVNSYISDKNSAMNKSFERIRSFSCQPKSNLKFLLG